MASKEKERSRRKSRVMLQIFSLIFGALIIAGPLFIILGSGGGPTAPGDGGNTGIEERQQALTEYVQANGLAEIVADSPRLGAEDATIFLIEFSDFQCPFCARAHGTIKQFIEENGDSVQLVYKHLPIPQIHPEAVPAARASWAAQQQGKFWEFHDALFENQARLGPGFYTETAEQLGLDIEQFNRDRNSPQASSDIQRDLDLARELGFTSTPTFMMNNILIPGAVPLEFFELALEQLQAVGAEAN